MGYMRHHAIIVSSWSERIYIAHQKAQEIFGGSQDLTPVQTSRINNYQTFFIGPDGSKEGWPDSDVGDHRRQQFIEWLEMQRHEDHSTWLDWVEVQYGDELGEARIVHHADESKAARLRKSAALARPSTSP